MAKRSKKNTTHVYTSTRVEFDKIIFRVGNFLVLLSMFWADSKLDLTIPETGYVLVLGAILGVDIPALTRRFLKKF